MKMKKWFKCLLMTMALMMVVGTGTVGTTIPAAAKAKTETVKVGGKFQKGKFQYKVTSLNGKTGTAALISVKSKKMASVTVPDTVKLKGYTLTVTEIGANAFKNCKKLKSVTTNTKIKKIGKNAFAGCKKLAAVNIKSTELSNVGKNALKGISKAAVVTAPAGTSYEQMLKVPVKTPAPTVRQTEKATVNSTQTKPVKVETKAEPETAAQTQTEPAKDDEAETEAAVETEAKAETEAVVETEAKAETETVVESATEETKAEPETIVPAETESKTEAQVQTKPQKAAPKVESKATAEETKPVCSEGHLYGEWTVARAATCTTAGTEERSCTICGAKETKAIAATGHTLGEPKIVPIPGSNCYGREVRECTSCDYVEKSNYSVHRQDVMQHLEDIPATCTTSGKTRRSYCPYCGVENFAWVKPLGHEYSAEWTTEEGTCVKAGIRYHKCVHEGCTAKADVQETVKAEGHQWVDASVAATCTAVGFDGQKCALCGERNGKEIQPLGHEYKTTVTEATCTKDGAEKTTCSRCGDTKVKVLPANGQHQWMEHSEVAATCSTSGHSAYTQCALCGEYKGDAKPKTLAATGEHRWILTGRTPYTVMGINDDDDQESITKFEKEVCKDCGVFRLLPGNGLKTFPSEDNMSGYIQWVVFISEYGWDTGVGKPQPLNQLYCHEFCLNGKKYAGYVPALRSSKTLSLTPLTPVVPAGKTFEGWKQVGSDGRPKGDYVELFDYKKTGKTFIAVFR